MANTFGRNLKADKRLTIVFQEPGKDGYKDPVVAHYNPKEIEFTKTVPWQKHPKSKADEPDLEFTGAEGRTLSMELLFDAYEANGTIKDELNGLSIMAKVKQDTGDEDKRRPPVLEIVNGPWEGKFRCVMESLSIKVTMFNTSNAPVRATVNVKFKEALNLFTKDEPPGSGGKK